MQCDACTGTAAMFANKCWNCINRDYAPGVNNCYSVTKSFGFSHVMSSKYHRGSAISYLLNNLRHIPPRWRVHSRGELVYKGKLGWVQQRKSYKGPLPLT